MLCGVLAAAAGLTSVASATPAPRSTLSTVPTVSLFAGDGSTGAATAGPALNTGIGNVNFGIAVDRFGDTFLSDNGNFRVYKVTPDGTLSVFAGDGLEGAPTPGPATSSSIGFPEGVAFDKAGNLYIADADNYVVYKVTPSGTLSIFAGIVGSSGTVTNGPATSAPIGGIDGLATDPSGNVYIASFFHDQIYKVTPGGALSVFAGTGSGAAATPGPATATPIGNPEGIAVDTAGNLYIPDRVNYYVYKVTPAGTLSIFAGNGTLHTGTAGPATHSGVGRPEYVAADGNDDVFIADNVFDMVYEVTPSGTLSDYAGQSGDESGITPGPAAASPIGEPQAIAIDPASGYLYVSNVAATSSFIYRITPAPGYWLTGAGGYVSGVNGAVDHGSLTASSSDPVVDIASDSAGYWLVTRSGTVHAYGDAGFYKDLPTIGVHVADIVAIAPTFDRKGYWLIGADGGEFAFGDAGYHGSLPGLGVHVDNIVGMVANANGSGYILVGSDGGVFVFGGSFHGSLPGLGIHVNNIRGILPTGGGAGYVLVGSDGGAFVFGHGSGFYGSLPGEGVHVNDVVGLALSPDQGGYWMAEANGNVHPFGDAPSLGTPAGSAAHQPVVGIGAS